MATIMWGKLQWRLKIRLSLLLTHAASHFPDKGCTAISCHAGVNQENHRGVSRRWREQCTQSWHLSKRNRL